MTDETTAIDQKAEGAAAEGVATDASNKRWYDTLSEEHRGVLQHKGWLNEDPVIALTKVTESYSHLEKMHGVPADRIVKLPGRDAKPEDWRSVFQKLGAPEKAEDYELPMPEQGSDAALADQAKQWFHKIGATKDQAKQFVEEWNAFATQAGEAAANDQRARIAADVDELKKEWGQAFDKRVNTAAAVMVDLGFDDSAVEGLRQALGTKRMSEMFYRLAEKMGEDSFVSSDNGNLSRGAMTPAQAKAELSQMQLDEGFRKALMNPRDPGHAAAVEKRERLYKVAYDM